MFVLLLFASHVQIALRLAVTDPTLWWTLAASKRLSAWTYFCVVYGAVSLVLWAGFYPPA
jgi:phosphatidylinositol glycan class V